MLELVQQMREDNGGKLPGVKKLAEAFGVSQKEAKEILEQCKQDLPPAEKKQKTKAQGGDEEKAPIFGEGHEPGGSRGKDEAVENVPPPTQEEPALDGEDTGDVEETLVDVPKGAFDESDGEVPESQPDRQYDGPSPGKTPPPPSIDRAETQRLLMILL